MRRACLSLAVAGLAALAPQPGTAQEDDRDYLTAFLEDNLSAAGRTVTITGFEGALSSRATIERLQIADDGGVWITLDGVVLDWSQSALLSGEVVVNELTAEVITLDRLPVAAEAEGPAPEATPFALPDLPVSIDIAEITAERIVLGEPVLGEALEARLTAGLTLAGGEGQATLDLERTDEGPAAQIGMAASYDNATGALVLDLQAEEEAGGIVARLLDLPGAPATALTVAGEGTLADFRADVRLVSDGEERLAGPLHLIAGDDGETRFEADLAGNVAPLFLPDYAAFLGDRVAFALKGAHWPTGAVELDRIDLTARALRLAGQAAVAGDGLPDRFDLAVEIGLADGTAVLLPVPGLTDTRLRRAVLAVRFDAGEDNGWSLDGQVEGVDAPGLTISDARIDGSGRIGRVAGRGSLGGTVDFAVAGLGGLDPAVLAAVGPDVAGSALFSWREGEGTLSLPRLALTGDGYAARGGLTLAGLDDALEVTGRLSAEVADMGRFGPLAGRPLGGAASVALDGVASPLSGAFDLTLDLTGTGLRIGQAEVDRLLAGTVVLQAEARRDEAGTRLRRLDLNVASLRLRGEGLVASAGSDLRAVLDWGDLRDLGGGLGGALQAEAGFTGTAEAGRVTLTGRGAGLRTGQDEVDRLLSGTVALDMAVRIAAEGAVLEALTLDGANVTATARGAAGGDLDVTGRLRDLALIAPELPGPVSLSGRLRAAGAGYTGDVRVQGPAGIDARVSGRFDGAAPDLRLAGTADAAVVNGIAEPLTLAGALGYDMRLAGGWGLDRLAGRVTLAGGRVSVPARGLSLQDIALAAELAGGRARLTATAAGPRGGRLRVDGPVTLRAPFEAVIGVQLEGMRLRDPELFDTAVSGALSLSGPVLGAARLTGELVLAETELRVPSTGFAAAADLDVVTHVNDGAEVRATRQRAGVGAGAGDGGAAAGGPDWRLDVVVRAPNRLFLRGRGLDAELGGEVRLGGSLRSIVPSGGLDLIRGRLDILGKRLDLSEASLVLEGALVPTLRVVASNVTSEVVSTVTIEGQADAPEVTFSSVPELPQEEVLAWLLFGRGLNTISALQAAQLANAIAVLAGRGGEGVIGRLRQSFGFDDLDVTTSEDGTTSVKAGKYVSENVYTEVGVDQDGKARINLNLDLRPGVTVKGRLDSDGESGVGIYLEKDY